MELHAEVGREEEQPLVSDSGPVAGRRARFSLDIARLIKRKCKSLWRGRSRRRRGRRWANSTLGRRICEVGARVRCLFTARRRRTAKLGRRPSPYVDCSGEEAPLRQGKWPAWRVSSSARKLMPIIDMDEAHHGHHHHMPMKGLVPVYVGGHDEHQRRVLIPIPYLNHPLFQDFLKAAEQEFGFEHAGALSIPCDLHDFQEKSLPCRRL